MRSFTSATSPRGTKGSGLCSHAKPAGLRFGKPVGHLAPHHQQGIGEASGSDEAGPGARARDQGVLADGAGVKEERGLPEKLILVAEADVPGRVPDGVGGAGGEVRRRGKRFPDHHLALVVDHDAIGEGAADVDSDDIAHGPGDPLSSASARTEPPYHGCRFRVHRDRVVSTSMSPFCYPSVSNRGHHDRGNRSGFERRTARPAPSGTP